MKIKTVEGDAEAICLKFPSFLAEYASQTVMVYIIQWIKKEQNSHTACMTWSGIGKEGWRWIWWDLGSFIVGPAHPVLAPQI